MAFGNWEEVIREYENYEEVFKDKQYIEHARGILVLIPLIRANPAFERLLPGTSHSTLFLKLFKHRSTVRIWYEGDNKYEVTLYHPDKGNLERVVVETQSVVDTVINFSNKLSELD